MPLFTFRCAARGQECSNPATPTKFNDYASTVLDRTAHGGPASPGPHRPSRGQVDGDPDARAVESGLRQGLFRVRLIAALAVVPLFGLMLFIVALDLFFHIQALADRTACQWRARRTGVLRLHP